MIRWVGAHKALAWVLAALVVAVVGAGVVVGHSGGQASSATEPDPHCVTAAKGLSSRVQLVGCRLPGVSLPAAYFYKANLSGALLSRADLRQADFTGANLSGTVFHKTIWNRTTVWPTGYNPPAPIAFFPVPTGS